MMIIKQFNDLYAISIFIFYLYVSCLCSEKSVAHEFDTSDKSSIYSDELVQRQKIPNSAHAEFTDKEKLWNNDFESSDTSPFTSEELLRRRRVVESYLAELGEEKKNWVEPRYLNLKPSESESENSNKYLNSISPPISPKYLEPAINDKKEVAVTNSEQCDGNNFHQLAPDISCTRDRVYLRRWLKKLLHKLNNNPYFEQNFIGFTFNSDSLKNLEEISSSANFDIESVDELIINAISNATSNHGCISFNFNELSNQLLIPVSATIIIFGLYLLFNPIKKHPLFALFMIFIGAVLWHAYKMYQVAVARKHAILARIPASACEANLNKESGIFDYLKEYIKYNFYDKECKKYYEELMVDAASEINILTVSTDLLSTVLFQIFYPFAKALNYFIKETFYDMSYLQIILTFVLIVFLLLLYFRYKIKFPFWLGSFEPAAVPVGSHVEDLKPLQKKSIFNMLLTGLSDSPDLKTEDCVTMNTDSYISERDGVKEISSNQTEVLPVLDSKLDFSDRKFSQKLLKFCKVCSEILLIDLTYTCNQGTENKIVQDSTVQGCFLSSDELESCQNCSIQLQTVMCDEMLLELENFTAKIVSKPCLHLAYICHNCTESIQYLVSSDKIDLQKDM